MVLCTLSMFNRICNFKADRGWYIFNHLQVASLQEEVQSYKAQLEAAVTKEHGARESELSCRKQLEELRTRLAEAERDLLESSSETISHETQHRSEVSYTNQ